MNNLNVALGLWALVMIQVQMEKITLAQKTPVTNQREWYDQSRVNMQSRGHKHKQKIMRRRYSRKS